MVAEQDAALAEMRAELEEVKKKMEQGEKERETEKMEKVILGEQIKKLENKAAEKERKEVDFIDALQLKFAQLKNEAEGKHMDYVRDLQKLVEEAGNGFNERDTTTAEMIAELKNKFREIDQKMQYSGGGGGEHSHKRRVGFLPEKMMVPEKFSEDIGAWRKCNIHI